MNNFNFRKIFVEFFKNYFLKNNKFKNRFFPRFWFNKNILDSDASNFSFLDITVKYVLKKKNKKKNRKKFFFSFVDFKV